MADQGKGCADHRGGAVIVRSSGLGVRSKIVAISILLLVSGSTAYAAQDQQIAQKLSALERIQGRFAFIVMGDNRSGDDIYRKIVALAVERKPDFVVNTGDVIATPGNKGEWTRFWAMSRPITVPYFLTVGNHDANPRLWYSENTFKEQVDLPGNELYYSFNAGNSLFVVLDSYQDDQERRITGKQLTWLESILLNSDKVHKFVFLHHPLYTDPEKGSHAGDCLDEYPKDRDRLEALFVKAKVDAVFAGHEHIYQRKTIDGVAHIITGGGGAPLVGSEEEGGFHHFVKVTVDGGRVIGEVVDVNGKIRDRF
jgi:3',5'-cyclic AMP phosphodiesterase CpdA